MSTKNRHNAIKTLITEHAIENQAQLVDLLHKHYDIITNQSIVSRDLQNMGINKRAYKGVAIYALQEIDPSKEIFQLGIVRVDYNESLIVITVLPGMAGFVCEHIDIEHEKLGVLGTIAGENQIFIAPVSTKNIQAVYKNICLYLHFKEIKEN